MGLKITRVGAALGVVAGLISFSATLVIISTFVPSGIVFVAGAAVGAVVGVFTALATSTDQDRLVRASWDKQSAVIRELVRITVPAAVDLATDRNGRLDPDRFRDLILRALPQRATRASSSVSLGQRSGRSTAATPVHRSRISASNAY